MLLAGAAQQDGGALKNGFHRTELVGLEGGTAGDEVADDVGEAEAGGDVSTLLRRHGISRATLYQWRSKYAGATVNELKRIKELEAEMAAMAGAERPVSATTICFLSFLPE